MEFKKLTTELYNSIVDVIEKLFIKNIKVDLENQQIVVDTDPTIDFGNMNMNVHHLLSGYLSNIDVNNKYVVYKTPIEGRYVIKERSDKICPPPVKCFMERRSFVFDIQGISIEIPVYNDFILYDKKEFIKELKRYLENSADAIGIYEDAIIIYSTSSRGTLVSNIEISRDEHDIIKDHPEFQHRYIYEKYDDGFEKIRNIVLRYIINLVKGDE